MTFDEIKESGTMAADTIWTNKIRSGLTILGVLVGVVTVMFMVSIIQGLNRSFAKQLEGIGSNIIYTIKFDSSFGRAPTQEERMRPDFTIADADALRNELSNIVGVSPLQRIISETVVYKEKQTDTPILMGVTQFYEEVHTQYVAEGRFMTETDLRERTNVVVLGKDVVKALFPN
jgi:putative ABC transport system permease protein